MHTHSVSQPYQHFPCTSGNSSVKHVGLYPWLALWRCCCWLPFPCSSWATDLFTQFSIGPPLRHEKCWSNSTSFNKGSPSLLVHIPPVHCALSYLSLLQGNLFLLKSSPGYRVYQCIYFSGKEGLMVSFFPLTFHRTSLNLSHFAEASRWCLNFTAACGKEIANQCFTWGQFEEAKRNKWNR